MELAASRLAGADLAAMADHVAMPDDISPRYAGDVALLSEPLRALLLAEVAAGNGIIEVGHSHPAAPVGVYFKLAGPVTTRPRASDTLLRFRQRGSSLYNGEFTDTTGFCFILEAPLPPPDAPDMDAIRAAANAPRPAPPLPRGDGAHDRFIRSMVIDYDKWHDGIGYDLEALEQATEDGAGCPGVTPHAAESH